MKNVTRNLVRFVVMPIAIGGAALGMAGMANASSAGLGGQEPTGPGHSFSPNTYAHPAPTVQGGWHRHGYAPIIVIGGDQN